jgi:hypothetical protein
MNECIIYQGYRLGGGSGYGQRTVCGVRWLAHRYAYFAKHGPIPDGRMVCHSCNNKGCINVEHLYLADNKTNIQHASRDGLLRPYNSTKTCCNVCGGPYKPKNKFGHRLCLPCRAAANRRSKLKARLRSAQSAPNEGRAKV